MPNRQGWLAILFIVLTLAIPFAFTYYVSTQPFKDRYQGWFKDPEPPDLPSRSTVTAGRVLLLKNEKVTIDRTCIVFKGLTGKKIMIDLYLLDLDPEIPYSLSFSQKAAQEGIWLGNVMYRLVSAKDSVLRLKIQSTYHTR